MAVPGCSEQCVEGPMPNSRRHPSSPCQPNSPDDRSPAARAAQWSSRIMMVSLEMVLPGLAGYWLDGKLGTKVLFMLIGFALGGFAAIKHLIAMTRMSDQGNERKK